MKKNACVLTTAVLMSAMMGITAYAGVWKDDSIGWWYQNDDGTYPVNSWQWIDGNHDGIAECYYFDNQGYCLINTTTPDGYTVDSNGAWVENQQVQTRASSVSEKKSYYTKEEAMGLALQYFNSQYPGTNGTNVIFIEETTERADNYIFVVRWQMSDEEAQRRLKNGLSVNANILNGFVVFNKNTGEMKIEL